MVKASNSGRRAMGSRAASRIQSAGDRNPASPTAQSGFGARAQSSAAQNATRRAPADEAVKVGKTVRPVANNKDSY